MSTVRTDNLQTTDTSFSVAVNNIAKATDVAASVAALEAEIASIGSSVGDSVLNVVALKALDKTTATVATTRGYYAAGDGGSCSYYLDAADTTSVDNGGSVIVATDGGRWKQINPRKINVRQWGAKGDGTGDDTSFCQKAITYAESLNGGEVFFPGGNYPISALTIASGPGVALVGESRTATVIVPTTLTGNVITMTAWYSSIRRMSIISSSFRTSGANIYMPSPHSVVDDVKTDRDFTAVVSNGAGSKIINSLFLSGASGGIRLIIGGGDTTQIIDNCLIGAQVGPFPAAGIMVSDNAALTISNTSVLTSGNSLLINPAAGQGVFSLLAHDCFFDTATRGVLFSPTGSGNISRIHFENCWFGTHTGDGVAITKPGGHTGTLEGIDFVNCDFIGNTGAGISIQGCTGTSVTNSRIAGNSFGIYTGTGVVNLGVNANQIGVGAGSPGNANYGLVLDASCDRYVVTSNRFVSNGSGGILGGAASATKILANNLVV